MDEKDGAVVDGYEEALAARYFDTVNAPIHTARGVSDGELAQLRDDYLTSVRANRHVQELLVAVRPKFEVWDVLVEECGARSTMFPEFEAHWPDCGEFRFQGSLGFGGKVYRGQPSNRPATVDCYLEDRNPVRDAAIARANERLAALSL